MKTVLASQEATPHMLQRVYMKSLAPNDSNRCFALVISKWKKQKLKVNIKVVDDQEGRDLLGVKQGLKNEQCQKGISNRKKSEVRSHCPLRLFWTQ